MAGIKAGPKSQVSVTPLPSLVGRTPAARVEFFFRTYLQHVKGEWAGQPLILAPWQRREIIAPLFNARDQAGRRQYRTCYVEVPRKNAKSTLAAGLMLYMLYCDGEPGAEVVSAAADRAQAAIVFDIARSMVEVSPELAKRTQIYRRELYVPGSESSYKVISSEAYSKHGMNLFAAAVDELHAHESGELLDVIRTSFGARRQPLLFMITTAGFDRTSVCWREHEIAARVRAGVVKDPTYLPVLYGADESDDWTSPKTWGKANPGIGVTIKREYLAQECRRAQEMPSYENTFRRLHLNQWTAQDERWLPQALWDACDGPADLETLVGRPCFAGIDLAATTDIAAAVFVFPEGDDGPAAEGRSYRVIPKFWIPRERIENPASRRDPRIREQLAAWVRQGLIADTPGDIIDNDVIRRDVRALGERVPIREIGYDRWGMQDMAPRLAADGFEMVPIGQGIAAMSGPMKELERLIRARRISHGGHPVLRWMFGNVAATTDADGNIKPSKGRSSEKIDGIVALIMAIDRASRHVATRSIYETRGVIHA